MRRFLVFSIVVIFVTLGLAGVAAAQATVSHVEQVDAAAVIAYWTPERMAAAEPANPALPGEPSPPAGGPARPSGPPSVGAGGPTGNWTLLDADDLELEELARTVEQPAGYSYPPPENTWPIPVTWYGSFPLRCVGKTYYTQTGHNYVASASVIGNRALLTAGHVVSDGAGNWSTNQTFIPAMRGSWKPYGTWVVNLWSTFTAWLNSGVWCRDVAAMRVTDQGGQTIGQKVSYLGWAVDKAPPRAWTGLGYPAVSPWTGSIMVATNASYSRSDAPGGCSPAAVGMGTRQTPGCSGGPWIWNYRAQQFNNNYANGVFSFYYTANPNEFFSPYFDSSVRDNIILPARAW